MAFGGEDEDAFAEGFEDRFQKAFVAEESVDEGLDLLGGQAIEPGKEFIDEGGLHGDGMLGVLRSWAGMAMVFFLSRRLVRIF